MYTVTIGNSFGQPLQLSLGTSVAAGTTWQSGNLGSLNIVVPGYGTIVLQDIASNHIPGDSTETWGVLVVYQGAPVVGRYEGRGSLAVTINQYGQTSLAGMTLREVDCPALLLP